MKYRITRRKTVLKGNFIDGSYANEEMVRSLLKGYAKNLSSGDVEIIAEGDKKNIESFIKSFVVSSTAAFRAIIHYPFESHSSIFAKHVLVLNVNLDRYFFI